MTLQQLKYMITVAEKGSITEAAKTLYISQPSLSEAIKEVEKETGITIFIRRRSGAVPTKEGMEFLGYARQVLEQMDILNSRYIDYGTAKQRFCVSTQHYTFTANAFVELVRKYGHEHYEFILNETQTHQIIEDVRNRFSDLGILFLSSENEGTLCRLFDVYTGTGKHTCFEHSCKLRLEKGQTAVFRNICRILFRSDNMCIDSLWSEHISSVRSRNYEIHRCGLYSPACNTYSHKQTGNRKL